MRQKIYATGRCSVCGKLHSRPIRVTVNPEDLAPVHCPCGGEVSFDTMAVHSRPSDTQKRPIRKRWFMSVPSESIANLTTLVVVALCLGAASLLLHCESLTATLELIVSGLFTMLVTGFWLAGRTWFRAVRSREERELREKFQAEGRLLRDRELKL